MEVGSIAGVKAHGLYIDSFIPPDRLSPAYVHENLTRVRAAACAITAGARIVSLGGFSSILIEGNVDQLPERHDTVFTRGNTLTMFMARWKHDEKCALIAAGAGSAFPQAGCAVGPPRRKVAVRAANRSHLLTPLLSATA